MLALECQAFKVRRHVFTAGHEQLGGHGPSRLQFLGGILSVELFDRVQCHAQRRGVAGLGQCRGSLHLCVGLDARSREDGTVHSTGLVHLEQGRVTGITQHVGLRGGRELFAIGDRFI